MLQFSLKLDFVGIFKLGALILGASFNFGLNFGELDVGIPRFGAHLPLQNRSLTLDWGKFARRFDIGPVLGQI